MDKMKKYLLYIVLLIGFALFSNLLIAVGLNSNYKEIENRGEKLEQVNIFQAEATKVNGRIRGVIDNPKHNIDEYYLKIDLYSSRDVYMGCKYIEIDNAQEQIPFELFFKLNNVSYYKTSYVFEKEPQGEIELLHKDLDKNEIFFATFVALVLFL